MSNEKRYWLVGGAARNDMRQASFSPSNAKQASRYALAAPQAQQQFSTNVSKSSLRNIGTRANDLLNFTYAKRERVGEQNVTHSASRTKRIGSKTETSYSKEQYILANCQFAIRYGAVLKDDDVDAPIDWQLVDYVRISACSDEMPHCPICLDAPPTAARITRCGHVYCYVCVLRYFSMMGDGKDEVACCPICAEPMRERDLRIAQLRLVRTYRVGDRLKFALIRRGDEAARREPVATVSVSDSVSQDDKNGSELFSKVIRISTEHLENVLAAEHELIESERQAIADSLQQNSQMMKCSSQSLVMNAAEFEDLEHQLIFFDLALGKMTERLSVIRKEIEKEAIVMHTIGSCSAETSIDKAEHDAVATEMLQQKISQRHNETDKVHKRYFDAFDDVTDPNAKPDATNVEDSEPQLPVDVTEPCPSATVKVSGPNIGSSSSCVYQSADGQPVFLHSLNVRCLLAQYGDSSASNDQVSDCGGTLDDRFPPFISGSIVQLDSFEMTRELRKRYKHLSHLPLLSHFTIAELDLANEPGLLEVRVVHQFSAQTDKRKAVRERRALEDRMRAAEAEQLALEREREHHAIFDRSNFPSLRTEAEELAEVNESELHNDASFPQIGSHRSSEGDSIPTSSASPTSLMPSGLGTTSLSLGTAPTTSNSVWFRGAETKRSPRSVAPAVGERQTFSALVKSISAGESKRQHMTKTDKKNNPEPASAAVWSKLKSGSRAGERVNADDDAEYEMDGASSLSHYKDAFQHDVDAALLRAFSAMSSASPASASLKHNDNDAMTDIRVASAAAQDEGLTCLEESEKQNTKRKKKAEKKTKSTLLFSTNMQRL